MNEIDLDFELTAQMKQDRMNCDKKTDCESCSCCIDTNDCVYNHIVTVGDTIKNMSINTLAIYLHSWQTENMSVDEIKDFLYSNSDDFCDGE